MSDLESDCIGSDVPRRGQRCTNYGPTVELAFQFVGGLRSGVISELEGAVTAYHRHRGTHIFFEEGSVLVFTGRDCPWCHYENRARGERG